MEDNHSTQELPIKEDDFHIPHLDILMLGLDSPCHNKHLN